MRVVCLQGSPREKGNSQVLLNAFCASATQSGADVSQFQLNDLEFKGCRNLMHCKTVSESCGQRDDLTAVLGAIAEADVVVLATPIYFTDIAGPLKLCLDRWFSFFVPDYPSAKIKSRLTGDKSIVMIQTQGESKERYAGVLDKYNHSFKWLGFNRSYLIRASEVREAGDIYRFPEVIQQAEELGRTLSTEVAN